MAACRPVCENMRRSAIGAPSMSTSIMRATAVRRHLGSVIRRGGVVECPSAAILGRELGLDVALFVADDARQLERHPVGVGRLERHACGQVLDEVAALGVEPHGDALAAFGYRAFDGIFSADGAWSHHPPFGGEGGIVELVEYGDRARTHGLFAESEHVFGIGPYLVESRVEGEMSQYEIAVATSVDYRQDPLFDDCAARVEEFDVQRAAQRSGAVRARRDDITAEPDAVALKVARVIEMQMHLFLWQRLAEVARGIGITEQSAHYRVGQLFLRRGCGRRENADCCQERFSHDRAVYIKQIYGIISAYLLNLFGL